MIKRILSLVLVLIIAILGFMFWKNSQVPDHVGLKDGRFAALPTSPNAVSSQTEESDRAVAPLPMQGDAAATRQAIEETLSRMETTETL